jgi:hypothetical protein
VRAGWWLACVGLNFNPQTQVEISPAISFFWLVQDCEKARGANYFKAQSCHFDDALCFFGWFLSTLKDKRSKIF